jgi:protein-S-isoprenylcysteine O-methyltransferase Ste14
MSPLARAILGIGWFVWAVPFILARFTRNKSTPQQIDRRARWGIVFQAIGFFLVWYPRIGVYTSPERTSVWRIPLAIVFFALADVASWTSFRALGRQWRFDAGLNSDHQLVRSGMYKIVRHPIYLSMIALMLGTGMLRVSVPVLVIAFILSVIGAEIRVRIEDRLLAARFGEQFTTYQQRVPAYIPFVR